MMLRVELGRRETIGDNEGRTRGQHERGVRSPGWIVLLHSWRVEALRQDTMQ
jgi:hypothetical protein